MSRFALLISLLAPAAAFGWGFDGHRRLASNLEEPFPSGSCLRAWLSTVTGQYDWQDKACDPDRWRGTDSAEGPRHYLDIDYADPIDSYPREWEDVVERFGQYAEKNGTVPFRVEEMYGRLVMAFQAQDGDLALDTVAWLSHYVTDAFSPMHDTKSQPGNCGATPECLHLRYETQMLDVASQIDAITQQARSYYGTLGRADPRNHVFDAVIAGHPLSQQLIYDDINAGGSMTALYDNAGAMTARRWGDALTLTASIVGTAWVEAGKPLLPGMPTGCDAAVAQGEVVLVGYPLPPPKPDAGIPPDAGIADGGGGNGGGGGGGNWLPPPPPPGGGTGGCQGCGGGPLGAVVPILGIALVLSRRRSR